MTLEKVVVPNEILFRLDAEGSVMGCHRKDLEFILDTETGQRYGEKELDPQPILGEAMDAILGLVNTALTASLVVKEGRCAALDELLAMAQEKVSALTTEKDLLFQSLSDTVSALEGANVGIFELDASLVQARESISALEAQNSSLAQLLEAANTALSDAISRIAELEALHAGAE